MTLQNLVPSSIERSLPFASNLSQKDDYDWVLTRAWNTCSEHGEFSRDRSGLLFESAYEISQSNEKRKRRKLHKNSVIIFPVEPETAEEFEISSGTGPLKSNDIVSWSKNSVSSEKQKTEQDLIRNYKSFDCGLQFKSCNGKLITDRIFSCSEMGASYVTSKTKSSDVKCLNSELEVSENVSIRNMCISVLGSQGLPGEDVSPGDVRLEVLENSKNIDNLQICEICGDVENTLNMLLCDHCEEAFHESCVNPKTKTFLADEWFCQSCSKLTSKSSLDGQFLKSLEKNCSNRKCRIGLTSIQIMMKYPEPYISRVRIGESFQAEVPEWSGQNSNCGDSDCIGEALEMDPSETVDLHVRTFLQAWCIQISSYGHEINIYSSDCAMCINYFWANYSHVFEVSSREKFSKSNLISNWLQCREVLHDTRGSPEETICGKWRRAPFSEVQTDNWDCSCSVLWEPSHSDCAVPQELSTDQILLQLNYIEQLRSRLATKRT